MPTDNRELAHLLGLTVAPRAPRLIIPDPAARVEHVDRQLAAMVGGQTRRTIKRDLEATGIDPSAPWVYAEMVPKRIAGRRFLIGRLIARSSYGPLVPQPFRAPHDWKDRHEPYRLEFFGRPTGPDDDLGRVPPRALWTWWPSADLALGALLLRARPRRSGTAGCRAGRVNRTSLRAQ